MLPFIVSFLPSGGGGVVDVAELLLLAASCCFCCLQSGMPQRPSPSEWSSGLLGIVHRLSLLPIPHADDHPRLPYLPYPSSTHQAQSQARPNKQMDDAADPGSSSATHKTLSTSTAAAALARARAPMTAVAPYPPRSRHRCPSPLAVFLVVVLTTMAAGAALTRRRVGPPPQQRIPQSVGFVVPPVSAAAAAARPAACPKGVNFYSGSTRGGRGGAVLLYARCDYFETIV